MCPMPLPKWATPERQAKLVEIFHRCGGRCVYGHNPCLNPAHYYEAYINRLIEDWAADDREGCAALLRRERELMHRCPDQRGWGRRFDPIVKERFLESRSSAYVEAVGVSGLTFTRIAKVRVPSSYRRLFVDVADSKLPSKNQRRKGRRYGLTPKEVHTVKELCDLAVKDFIAHNA